MNVNREFFIKLLELAEEYGKLMNSAPLRDKTVAHFVHWVFNNKL
jgi:hypothetical protein